MQYHLYNQIGWFRSTQPLMGHGSSGGHAKWMDGVLPGLYCNDPFVVFMQSSPQPVIGEENAFRLYFGMGGTYVGAKLGS
jgi:hypothetical protein